jgi:transcriptional regulator with XRE-family HTH domain
LVKIKWFKEKAVKTVMVSTNLKDTRTKKRIKLKDLAGMAGIEPATLSNIESGRASTTRMTATRIAQGLKRLLELKRKTSNI